MKIDMTKGILDSAAYMTGQVISVNGGMVEPTPSMPTRHISSTAQRTVDSPSEFALCRTIIQSCCNRIVLAKVST